MRDSLCHLLELFSLIYLLTHMIHDLCGAAVGVGSARKLLLRFVDPFFGEREGAQEIAQLAYLPQERGVVLV